jgi:hypothetical protein
MAALGLATAKSNSENNPVAMPKKMEMRWMNGPQ